MSPIGRPDIQRQWKALHQEGLLLPCAGDLLCRALEREAGLPLSKCQDTLLREQLARRCGEPPQNPIAMPALEHMLPEPDPGSTGELLLDLLAKLDPGAGKRGQVFTPWTVAMRLADLLEPSPGQRWLDPAAGTGILLRAARAHGAESRLCQALEPDALFREVGRLLGPSSSWHGGDALSPWKEMPTDWRGHFQRVILNPPYRNGVEARDPQWVAWRQELRARFSTTQGPFDLYIPFVERALELLEPGGRLGLLMPMAWLASANGSRLRLLLGDQHRLLRLQHAPGVRLFPRADLDAMLLVVEAHCPAEKGEADLVVEELDRHLEVVKELRWPQQAVRTLARKGWGPLLWPPGELCRANTSALGESHGISASLSADEYYRLTVREEDAPRKGELRLYSSGAIEPFHSTWEVAAVRFRGQILKRPVVCMEGLSPSRRDQVERPRVLIANLSRKLEALAAQPGQALGVVNVIQVFCADMTQAHALAAWLNSAPLRRWTTVWLDPLRLHTQLALTRDVVSRLPGLPASPESVAELARLGEALARAWQGGSADLEASAQLQERLDALAARHFSCENQ